MRVSSLSSESKNSFEIFLTESRPPASVERTNWAEKWTLSRCRRHQNASGKKDEETHGRTRKCERRISFQNLKVFTGLWREHPSSKNLPCHQIPCGSQLPRVFFSSLRGALSTAVGDPRRTRERPLKSGNDLVLSCKILCRKQQLVGITRPLNGITRPLNQWWCPGLCGLQ